MNVATVPGSFDSGCAMRPGASPVAQSLVGALLVRVAVVLGGVRGDVLVLSLVGLLVLVLITTGCGPPN